MEPSEIATTIGLIVGAIVVIGILVLVFNVLGLWFQAWVSGAHIGLLELIGMRFRKVHVGTIVLSRIESVKAGVAVSTNQLEAHYLAGGNVPNVVRALIIANRAKINLDFARAATIDLAGRDVLDAVRTSVNPKVIDCPAAGGDRTTIDAICKNGIQLKARARVTVRTNLDQLVGGATEETIIARVGEGIVSAIGSASSHPIVLENPDVISKQVLAKGLDAGTAYEILSIDIADVDVGENIGANLQAEQAEADKRVAQARAEERRAMAVALEQEMQAKVQENRAAVVLAEAEVPKALAEALRSGKLGALDYYQLQNVVADTGMRSAIAGSSGKPSGGAKA
ncbi:MAG: flotillin-like protein FloA [Planctomycetes bacterium]|nr:flotillin-like protein FloA [Planctomycetota bacterium]NUQ34218.1 flotillin-like protein FloA [Planctomycetaceae bacterium]